MVEESLLAMVGAQKQAVDESRSSDEALPVFLSGGCMKPGSLHNPDRLYQNHEGGEAEGKCRNYLWE